MIQMSDSSSDQPSPPHSHDWTMETPKAFPSQSCPEPDSVPFTGATISNETVLPSIETEHDEDLGDCPVCALEANMRDPCAKPGPLINLVFKTLSPEIPHQTRNAVCRLVAQRCSCDGVWKEHQIIGPVWGLRSAQVVYKALGRSAGGRGRSQQRVGPFRRADCHHTPPKYKTQQTHRGSSHLRSIFKRQDAKPRAARPASYFYSHEAAQRTQSEVLI